MATPESRDLEVEEEWEDCLECCELFTEGSSNEKTLNGRHKSCGSHQEDDVAKSPPCKTIGELDEVIDIELSGETMAESNLSASVTRGSFPEISTEEANSEMSSAFTCISPPESSKFVCDNCSKRSDLTQNPTNEEFKVHLTSLTHGSNDDNLHKLTNEEQTGQKVTYCTECKKPLRSTDSISHPKESESNDFADTHRAAIQKLRREMSDRESDARKKLEAMDYESTEFLRKTVNLQHDINRRRTELKELVDRHADSLLVEVDSWMEEVSKAQGEELETLRRYVDSLDSYKSSCKEILVDGSVIDIQQAAADLERKEKELRHLPNDGFQRLFHGFHVSLKKTNVEGFLSDYYNNNNIVGVLEDESDIQDFEQISEEKSISSAFECPTRKARIEKFSKDLKHRDTNGERIAYREDPALVGTLRTNAAEKEDKGILGVAFLEDELFVVSRESSEVEVFDCRRFIFSCELDLDCLLNPEDIGSCSNRKCLYIMDRKRDRSRSEILRVDTDGNLIKRWSTGGQWGRISVTPDTNILLCICKTTRLHEYTPDGILVRVIRFSPEVGLDHPRHAVKLTSGHFLVGHGETGDPVHRVVRVDASGKVVGSFCGSSDASENEMLKRPFCLAADAEGQCVLVADAENRRVLMLNNALELQRELLSGDRHGLRYPARICIDASSGLLFVADNKAGDKRILVFLIK